MTSSSMRASYSAPPANDGVNATVRLVTPRACARGAPIRPSRYAVRWADLSRFTKTEPLGSFLT
jgi:hypothetical protein